LPRPTYRNCQNSVVDAHPQRRARHQVHMHGSCATVDPASSGGGSRRFLPCGHTAPGRENPCSVKQHRLALVEMPVEPVCPGVFRNPQQPLAWGVLRNDSAHVEQARFHAVTTDRRDVRTAPVPRRNRQHPRADHVSDAGAFSGCRTAMDGQPARPGSRQLQRLGLLTHGRRCALPLPAHLNLVRHPLHASARKKWLALCSSIQFPLRLIHSVTSRIGLKTTDCRASARLHAGNCSFQGKGERMPGRLAGDVIRIVRTPS